MAAKPTRIRIGIQGLSIDPTSWSNVAHLPYLKSKQNKAYVIAAVCNSTVASSTASIAHHELPDFEDRQGVMRSVRAYGSPEDLAKDIDVDLVVCVTDVRKHYACIKPSVLSGKNVFVEWPLAANLDQVTELVSLQSQNKAQRALVGLEDWCHPAVEALRQVACGSGSRIGQIRSVDLALTRYSLGENIAAKHEYAIKRENAAGMIEVHIGHALAAIQYAVGDVIDPKSVKAIASAALRDTTVRGEQEDRVSERTTADHVALAASFTASGAPVSLRIRVGEPFPGDPPVTYTIEGSKGQVRFTAPMLTGIQAGDTKVHLMEYGNAQPEVVNIEAHGNAKSFARAADEMPVPARNIARLYQAFANGETEGISDWNVAYDTYLIVSKIWESIDASGGVR